MIWWAVAFAGELGGTVTDAAGDPVAGATVVVYDQRLGYEQGTTASDGTWAIELRANPYRVRVLPPGSANLLEQWAPAGVEVCAATAFRVTASGGPRVDVALSAGSELFGSVDVPHTTVFARTTSTTAVTAPRSATADESGAFVVRGVRPSPDPYVVELRAAGHPNQWVGGTTERGLARAIAVSGASADAGATALLRGATVYGTAIGPNGPLDGVAHGYGPSQVVDATVTDGAFALVGLPAGDVLVWVQGADVATTWYPDVDRPGARVPIEEAASAELTVTLPSGGRLRGRVVGGTAPETLSVVAYNTDRTVAFGALLDGVGGFEIPHVHGGEYLLYVIGDRADLVSDFIRDDVGVERTFTAPSTGDSPLYELAPVGAARIEGTVVGAYGGVAYGAQVIAESIDTGRLYSATAAFDGAYALRGLPAGQYALSAEYVHLCPSDAGFTPVWYPDRRHPALGQRVTLVAGDVVTWDAPLAPDDDHDEMDDVWEVAVGLDPTRDDAAEDPDGDGVSNLDEYRLDGDPLGLDARGCGCDGGGGAPLGFGLLPLLWTRRRR